MTNNWSLKEVIDILELAIGEVDERIPSDVLECAISYLREHEQMKINETWDKYPDAFY